MKNINVQNLENIQIENVDPADHPDYVDAFISHAELNGRVLTEKELEWLQENEPDWIFDKISEYAIDNCF